LDDKSKEKVMLATIFFVMWISLYVSWYLNGSFEYIQISCL